VLSRTNYNINYKALHKPDIRGCKNNRTTKPVCSNALGSAPFLHRDYPSPCSASGCLHKSRIAASLPISYRPKFSSFLFCFPPHHLVSAIASQRSIRDTSRVLLLLLGRRHLISPHLAWFPATTHSPKPSVLRDHARCLIACPIAAILFCLASADHRSISRPVSLATGRDQCLLIISWQVQLPSTAFRCS
jgi:hypothetical protein